MISFLLAPIITALICFYLSSLSPLTDALMSLSSDQWRDLQVPIRLVNEVQRLIALPTSCSISVQDSNQQVHDIKPPKLQIKKAERDNFEDEYLTAGRP